MIEANALDPADKRVAGQLVVLGETPVELAVVKPTPSSDGAFPLGGLGGLGSLLGDASGMGGSGQGEGTERAVLASPPVFSWGVSVLDSGQAWFEAWD